MTTKMIKILLADDHQILRGGLQAVIDVVPDLEVIGHASDGNEAVELYRTLHPDVVIMDLVMPVKDGIEATSDIVEQDPDAHILVLTSFSESDEIMQVMRAGAIGYFLKSTPPENLINAIRNVHAGKISLHPDILKRVFNQEIPGRKSQSEQLTGREYEILKLVARGMSNEEIAATLTLSKRTINSHIFRINSKFNLENRAQMVLYALQNGILGIFPSNRNDDQH